MRKEKFEKSKTIKKKMINKMEKNGKKKL